MCRCAQYTENLLVFTALEVVAKVEMAAMLLDRLTARETERQVDVAAAASLDLRRALTLAEDDLDAFAESPLAKNEARRDCRGVGAKIAQGWPKLRELAQHFD